MAEAAEKLNRLYGRATEPAKTKDTYDEVPPVLLVDQDAIIPKAQPAPGKDWLAIQDHLEQRLNSLRNWRTSYWVLWGTIAQYLLPRRYRWLVTPNNFAKGGPINQMIVDPTGTHAMLRSAASLQSGIMSSSSPWFELTLALEDEEDIAADAQDWLSSTEDKVYDAFSRSNFYTTGAQAFQDVLSFGTAPVIIYEDRETIIRCYGPCAGEYFLDVGGTLTVDTLYREESRNTLQIIQRFGFDNCPQAIQKAYRDGGGQLQREWIVAHAIEPNFPIAKPDDDSAQIRPVPAGFQWRESYWLRGVRTERELSRCGFRERPFVAMRWAVTSNDPYGRGLGEENLGDMMQLQVETRRKAEYLEKGVRPPMSAPVELKNEPASINPGQITYVTEQGKFVPLFQVEPAWMGPITADLKEIQQRIKDGFFEDIFMAISGREGVQPLNELELTQRDLERLQVLGPFIDLCTTEVAGPSIIRVLSILQRTGRLDPMPPSLRGKPLKINYTSILSIAQRRARGAEVKDLLVTTQQADLAAQAAGEPSPGRNVNWDKLVRQAATVSSSTAGLLYTEDQVKQADAMKAKQAQQTQAMQASMAAVTAAKSLGDTSTAPGTALNAITGGQQQ